MPEESGMQLKTFFFTHPFVNNVLSLEDKNFTIGNTGKKYIYIYWFERHTGSEELGHTKQEIF